MGRAKSLRRLIVMLVVTASAAGALFPVGQAQAQPAGLVPVSGEQVKGELNGWGTWAMSSSLGATFIYDTGQVAAVSDTISEFKFFKDSNQWYSNGGGITFGVIFGGMNTFTGSNMSFNHTQNKFYAFKWNGNDKGVIFQLSAVPAAITGVSQLPVSPTSSDSVNVTATTNTALPSEQALWLRYAINGNWAGSTVVKMTGSGTSYSATIPAQANGTQVSYYVFSSGNVGSIAGSDADLMTISYDTNGGSNYSYTVASAPGIITVTNAKAIWLDTTTIAWNGIAGSSYKLLYDPDGGVQTLSLIHISEPTRPY